jgi:hypothetical protein
LTRPKLTSCIVLRSIHPTRDITGYVNESTGEDETGGQLVIDDEGGDVITEITGFGLKTDVTLEVIPKSTVGTPPAVGDVFTYGAKKITILGVSKKRIKKDVEKWTIKGDRFPGIALT